jgi:hypothetical protein
MSSITASGNPGNDTQGQRSIMNMAATQLPLQNSDDPAATTNVAVSASATGTTISKQYVQMIQQIHKLQISNLNCEDSVPSNTAISESFNTKTHCNPNGSAHPATQMHDFSCAPQKPAPVILESEDMSNPQHTRGRKCNQPLHAWNSFARSYRLAAAASEYGPKGKLAGNLILFNLSIGTNAAANCFQYNPTQALSTKTAHRHKCNNQEWNAAQEAKTGFIPTPTHA